MDVLTKVIGLFGSSFSGPAFSSPCDLVCHFPVLHFPVLYFPPPPLSLHGVEHRRDLIGEHLLCSSRGMLSMIWMTIMMMIYSIVTSSLQ